MKRGLARACLAALALLALPVAALAAGGEWSLDRQVEDLPDPQAQWSFRDVSAGDASQGFKAITQPVFNGGFTNVVHWFRVTIPDEVPNGEWLLEFGYPLLDFVDVYLPGAGGTFEKVETGDQRPFAARPVQHRNFVLPMTLADGVPRTVYVRVATQSTLQLPLTLWSPHAFIEKSQGEQYLLGIYYGIILVMTAYNLFAYLLVRDTSYLIYLAYIMVQALLQAALNGLSAQYLFADSPLLTNFSLPMALAGTILFASLFTHSFLETGKNLPKLNRLLWALFAFSVICTIAIFFVPYSASIQLTSVLAGTMTFVFFAIGLRALYVGVRAARFFMLAWAIYLLAIQVRILLGFGLVPSNLLTLYSPQIGSALEVTLLALALADRITLERQEKERLGRERAIAQAATEAKSEFLARMSHEIRTPINAVTGFTDLALRTSDEPQRLEYLRQIRGASRSLLALINDILDMSRVEAGKLSLSAQDFRLAPLLDAVRDLFTAQAAGKGVELRVAADPDTPGQLRGDPVRLEQVLVNLVSNALKFTERGRVEVRVGLISATTEEVRLRFAVTDTGIGIPAPQRVRLFEPFSQGDESITRRYGGTGLGLAICKQLVELMGGQIGVDSTVGEGSTFHFTVRLGRASGPLRDTQPEDLPLASFPGARVLVVEDNALNQRLAQEMLAALGAKVSLAGHGGEAVEAVRTQRYDAILMDVQMPEMDGLEATRRIRSLPEGQSIPIVAMTAHALAGSREQCEAAGMNDFLGKPITARGLATTLARWLTPSPAPARAAQVGSDEDLPESLPGLQLGQALRRLGGNRALVRTSLVEFRRDYGGYAGELALALERNDARQAARIAHTLKGVAANLSMPDLEASARAAEEELAAGGTLAPSSFEALRAALAVVSNSCAQVAPEPSGAGAALSEVQLRAALGELRALIERNDFSAPAAFKRCEAALRERCGLEALEPLSAALARFDFGAARAPLATLETRVAGATA